MISNDKRCVITGLGMICAVGNSVDECWKNVLSSKSGIEHTHSVSTDGCYADYAAEVKCDSLDTEETRGMDRASKLCVKAAHEAMADAGLDNFGGNGNASVIMGSCVGGVVSIESYYTHGKTKEKIEQMPISAIASQVANVLGAGGTVTNVANACAAGTISISYAADLIRAGKADVVIAGGADAFASVPYAGFLSLHALSEAPCSPFNHSSGLTLGEGAGVLVVESYAHALARGAKIYCEVLGSGIGSDAYHITAPRPDGEGQINAILTALRSSGITEKDLGYINAHGTGTAKNDEAEFLSLHTIFDGKNGDLSVSSTKAMTGHCLGAAGAIEAVFSVKALIDGIVPPTVGYTPSDVEALKEKAGELDFCPNVPRKKTLENVMSNSFAFGGNNASIVFGKSGDSVKAECVKRNVYITGLGAVTPRGNGVPAYIRACGENIRATGDMRSSVGAADYDELGIKMAFYRKMDRFSQLQVVSGMQALKDADFSPEGCAQDVGIIVGTSEGALGPGCDFETIIAEKGNGAGSAFKFPNTVYNAAGGYLSICSGIKGYNVTVTNGAQSGLFGITYAMDVMRAGKSKAVLVGGSDENSDIIRELYTGLGLALDSPKSPYSLVSDGFALSDGSASLLLEAEEEASARGAKAYCRVAGCGISHRGVKFATLDGSGEALDGAILRALSDAELAISDVDAIIGFADGHRVIDGIELASYGRIFGEKLKNLPVISVKERMGEARAASAALAVMHGALILHGDIESEECAYCLYGGKPVKKSIKCSGIKTVLVTAFGAGGTYSAIVLDKNI